MEASLAELIQELFNPRYRAMKQQGRANTTVTEDAEFDSRVTRRETLVRRACEIMGWDYSQSPVFAGLRKVALAEAVTISLDKLEQLLDRIDPPKDGAGGCDHVLREERGGALVCQKCFCRY